jgi:signal transduction histidine kinase/ActR/RegA family two-component response regulator
MRSASALTAALAVAALGGLAVATIIDAGYHRLRDLEEIAAAEVAALTKLHGIRDSAGHALADAGLGLQSGNADLVAGAMLRLSRTATRIEGLASGMSDEEDERLARIGQLIRRITAEAESRPFDGRRLDAEGPIVRRAALDPMAAELDELIARLQEDASTRAEAARAVRDSEARHRQRADPVLLAGYSVLMLLVLLALLRYIAAPVQRLTLRAEDAMELGHSFRPVTRGPREIKQLGGTIASLVGDLEAKVSERTSELAEQAVALRSEVESRRRAEIGLRRAITAAEAASEAKSKFLSVMSHELRTPMNAVLGTLDLLRDTPLENEQETYVETARESGRALMSLLNDVLDLTKIEAGRLGLSAIEFDVIETLDQILSLFHPECCKKGVVLTGSLAPDVPRHVRGDPLRIRQILTHLVGNAVKFTDDGRILVRIETNGDGRGGLAFAVKDTGAGIGEKDQPHVFDDFAQADRSHARRHGGTGLGLAICRRLVEAMGGTIALSSKPGEGSEFRFTVPDLAPGRDHAPRDDRLRSQLSRINLIIAGSCFALAESLRSVFDQWVASVRIATDPVTLSRIVSDCRPHTTCIICGPPDRPAWPALLSAARSCCSPGDMLAVVPCVPGAAQLAARHGEFGAIYDRALKPRALMELVCGQDISDRHERLSRDVRGTGGNILLVEDSAANRLVASAMLEKAGYTVAIAENGRAALEAMSNCSADLVLMDLQMPVMDGYDALEAIRALPGPAGETPVIALSANVMAQSDAERPQLSFDAYLAKPLSRTELLDTVARVLDRSAERLGYRPRPGPNKHA